MVVVHDEWFGLCHAQLKRVFGNWRNWRKYQEIQNTKRAEWFLWYCESGAITGAI